MSTAMTNDPSLVDLFSEGRTMRKLMNCTSIKTSKIKTALILDLWNGYVSRLQGNGIMHGWVRPESWAQQTPVQRAGSRQKASVPKWTVSPRGSAWQNSGDCSFLLWSSVRSGLTPLWSSFSFSNVSHPQSPHRFQLEQEGAQASPKKSWAFRQFPKWCLALVSGNKMSSEPSFSFPPLPSLSSVIPYLCISLCLFFLCLPWFLSLYFIAGCNMRPLKLPQHWLTTAGVRSVVSEETWTTLNWMNSVIYVSILE